MRRFPGQFSSSASRKKSLKATITASWRGNQVATLSLYFTSSEVQEIKTNNIAKIRLKTKNTNIKNTFDLVSMFLWLLLYFGLCLFRTKRAWLRLGADILEPQCPCLSHISTHPTNCLLGLRT